MYELPEVKPSNYHSLLSYIRGQSDIFEKYRILAEIQAKDQEIFFYILKQNVIEMLPIVYTPGVGAACLSYGQVTCPPNALTISVNDIGSIGSYLEKYSDIQVIVVTDGERILGLGDLGVWGMGIPVGKLALYSNLAGIDPKKCLPVTIDAGTNNEKLLEDPTYKGLKINRVRDETYEGVLEEFVTEVEKRFPKVLLQFEDFGQINAFWVLEKYQRRLATFNDDIQGTAAVTVAGLINAIKLSGNNKLGSQKFLFLGGGQAANGIADLLVHAMVEKEGMDPKEAVKLCSLINSKGLIHNRRSDFRSELLPYANDLPEELSHMSNEEIKNLTLEELVGIIKPTALIGVSGQPQKFTKSVLEKMAEINPQPIIFALSNPTSKSECSAEQAYTYTNNKAIFASGSPFPDYLNEGVIRKPGQANNCYIFPGVGLGVIISGATQVTQDMMLASAYALADLATEEDLDQGTLFPSLERSSEFSSAVAGAVAFVAQNSGFSTASFSRLQSLQEFTKIARQSMYEPKLAKNEEL